MYREQIEPSRFPQCKNIVENNVHSSIDCALQILLLLSSSSYNVVNYIMQLTQIWFWNKYYVLKVSVKVITNKFEPKENDIKDQIRTLQWGTSWYIQDHVQLCFGITAFALTEIVSLLVSWLVWCSFAVKTWQCRTQRILKQCSVYHKECHDFKHLQLRNENRYENVGTCCNHKFKQFQQHKLHASKI
jgi:hypothetical protein